MLGLRLILGLVSVSALCPSPSYVEPTSVPSAPVFPTTTFAGTMPTAVLEDHYGEIAKIGAYRPPRIIPYAQPVRTNCAHLATGLKNWHDSTTWGGTIPTSGNVTIPAGKRVLVAGCSINPATIWEMIVIPVTSELIFADAVISIKTKGMDVRGKLTIGTPTCRLQNKITIELGPAPRVKDDSGLTKGIVVTGTVDIHGVEYAPTWTRLASTAAAGATVIFVQDLVNWEVGQEIVITTTELKDARDFNHNEVKIISKVEKTSYAQVSAITLTTPLAWGHYGGSEYQAEVGLLSRRIKIQGDAASEPTDTANLACKSGTSKSTYPCTNQYLTGFGGHLIVNGSLAAGRLQGVELYRMGQTNMLGRYPAHFHLMGDALGTDRALFRDNAVHHSFFRCYAIHGTFGAQISRNVGYDAVGHCFFIEDGIEENNTLSYNLAAHVHPLGPINNPSDGLNGDSWWSQGLSWYTENINLMLPSDMSAAGFYITNMHNDFIGNAASGGWTGFAMPTLQHPVKLFAARTDVSPRNRPFRSAFRGNTAHSSGFWWRTAGAFYIGGQLRTGSGGLLEYTAGRSLSKDTCIDETVDTTPGTAGGCWDVADQLWLRFEDNKAFLANRGLQNWGERSELIRFEFHNVGLAMNVFGKVLIDQMLMECRSTPVAALPTWFSGCNTSRTNPNYNDCNRRDMEFWTSYQGFQWYDVGQMHILTNSIFRNCPATWSNCVFGPAANTCNDVSVFVSLTHSDWFVPQMQQATAGVKFENCGKKWAFTTALTDDGKDTVSGRLQSWVDFDGSVTGRGVRTMLGSAWAGDWWKYNSQCDKPSGSTEFWSCPMLAKDSFVSIFFGYNTYPADIMPGSIGVSNCMNGGQSQAAGNLCPIIGVATHFGRAQTTGINVALNGKVTGPLIGCSGGWYVRFLNGPPQVLTMSEFQIQKTDNFILAIPYPTGTTFTIKYLAANWCSPASSLNCAHTVTSAASLAAVRAGFGDLYYWDSVKGILYIRVVQRGATFGNTAGTWTSIVNPDVTFDRNGLSITEVAYQTYLQITATGTMGAVDPGVPAAFDTTCAAVPDCPADQVWPATGAGASRILPCATGYYGTQLRRCGVTGAWESVVTANCHVGNAFCPADQGWELTAPGILNEHQCPAGQTGVNSRQCDSNGLWGSAVVTCAGTPTCTDGIQNGVETAIDCGGGTCPACLYCQTIVCGTHGTCVEGNPPTCTCSGGWTGSRCDVPPPDPCLTVNCGAHGTCNAGLCTCTGGYTGTLCATPPAATCSDGIMNQGELNIDCGGPNCPACPSYSWSASVWTACSLPCNGGVQTRNITCINQAGVVSPVANCDAAHPLISSQSCNVDPCPVYSWRGGAWMSCSTTCGGGNQTRQVDCLSSIGDVVVNSDLCNPDIRPTSWQGCNPDPCTTFHWVTGTWTDCTLPCGGGTQSRSVDCLTSANAPAPTSSCTASTKPGATQSCNLVECATYSWKACPSFYPCTAQCNGGGAMVGIQYRDVFCFKDQDLSVVDNTLCPAAKPTSQLSVCNTQKCTGPNWMADSNWGPCVQGSDGVFVRTRTFHCHNADGTTALQSVCTAGAGPLPIAILPCSPGTCADANGCPQVQIGAIFNDCVAGFSPCSAQCTVSTQQLADELNVLSLRGPQAVQCVKDLSTALPAGFRPQAGLVNQITASLGQGQLNICAASISSSTHVVVSWVTLSFAFVLSVL